MSGTITILSNGNKRILYVHRNAFELFDNILRGLVEMIVCNGISHTELLERFNRMRIISLRTDDDIYNGVNVPSEKDIVKYVKFASDKFNRDKSNWYSLLSKCQGDIVKIFKSGIIIDTTDLEEKEYNVTIDLDKMIISPTYDSLDYPYTIKIKGCIIDSNDESDDNDSADSDDSNDSNDEIDDEKSVLLIDKNNRKKIIKFL